MTQQYRLSSMAAQLPSKSISAHNLLPHIPLISLSAVKSSPRPGISPQSLNSSSQQLCLSGDQHSFPGVCMAAARIVWFPFYLGCHRSAVSLSALNVSPLIQTIALMWGSDSCFSSPPTKDRSCPTNTPVFPPSSFILLRFEWFYIFFSTGQIVLSTLSRCSACTSVSQGVFLMYPWRGTYSTSTYYPAILFSPPLKYILKLLPYNIKFFLISYLLAASILLQI